MNTPILDTDNERLLQYAMLFDKAFVDTDGQSWYNAKHVGNVLDMAKRSIYHCTTRGWFKDNDTLTLGRGNHRVLYLSQPAVYHLLMRSHAKLSNMFREPKTNEEIKAIRKELRKEMAKKVKAAKVDQNKRIQASFFGNYPWSVLEFVNTCIKEN